MAFQVYVNVVLLLLCCNNMPKILCLTTLCCWYIEPYLWFVYFLISLSANQTASLHENVHFGHWADVSGLGATKANTRGRCCGPGRWFRSGPDHVHTIKEPLRSSFGNGPRPPPPKALRAHLFLSLSVCVCVRVFIYLFKEESQNSSTETEVIPFRS